MTDAHAPLLTARVAAAERLFASSGHVHAPAVLALSFGTEHMVVLDLIVRARLQIRTFRLDEATHDTIVAAMVVA